MAAKLASGILSTAPRWHGRYFGRSHRLDNESPLAFGELSGGVVFQRWKLLKCKRPQACNRISNRAFPFLKDVPPAGSGSDRVGNLFLCVPSNKIPRCHHRPKSGRNPSIHGGGEFLWFNKTERPRLLDTLSRGYDDHSQITQTRRVLVLPAAYFAHFSRRRRTSPATAPGAFEQIEPRSFRS